MKRVAVSAGVVFASVLAALVAFELLLRVVGYSAQLWYAPDPQLGWRLRPGLDGVNREGWRDRAHELEKRPGAYRIVLLGDAYSEARQVPLDKTFWSLLPARLSACGFAPGRRIEVLNFGIAGFGTAQEYLALRDFAIRYRPDLVLLQFTNGNDVIDISHTLDSGHDRPFFRPGPNGELRLDDSFAASAAYRSRASARFALLRSIADHSRALQLVHWVREHGLLPSARAASLPGAEQGLEPLVLRAPADVQWEHAWRMTEALISKTRDFAVRNGARFVLFTVPYAIQVDPDPRVRAALARRIGVSDLLYPGRRIAELARRKRFLAIALAPQMQRIAQASGTYLHGFPSTGLGRGHWNETGHRVAAGLIARSLCAGAMGRPDYAVPVDVRAPARIRSSPSE